MYYLISRAAFARASYRRSCTNSVFNVPKKLSTGATLVTVALAAHRAPHLITRLQGLILVTAILRPAVRVVNQSRFEAARPDRLLTKLTRVNLAG